VVEQLGGQLAADSRAVMEDLLELRQLYSNLRPYLRNAAGPEGNVVDTDLALDLILHSIKNP
jgi:hypothetical protein